MKKAKVKSAKSRPYHHGDLRRALVDAAFALVTEEQDWGFSLREVSRRAGVSHTAVYNHFVEKRDLLAAVAAKGFDLLRARMFKAIADLEAADAALAASGHAYVGFAVAQPALYRLMFGPTLAARYVDRPQAVRTASAQAEDVLQGIILRGARSGGFAIAPVDHAALATAALTCWSAVHGLSMLIIDGKDNAGLSLRDTVDRLVETQLNGLKPRPAEDRAAGAITRAGHR